MGETRKLGKKALLVLVCRLLALNFSTFLSVPIHKYLTLIPAARISLSPRISPESTLEHGDYSMILVYSLTKEKGWAFHDHSRSYRPASARSSPGLGILNRLLPAMEGRPIKSVRDSSIVLSLLPW